MGDHVDPYDRSDPRPEAYHRRMEIQQRELEIERDYARLDGRLRTQPSPAWELSWRGALVGAVLVGMWANMQHVAPGGPLLVGAALGLLWRVWFKMVALAGVCMLIFVFSQAPRERNAVRPDAGATTRSIGESEADDGPNAADQEKPEERMADTTSLAGAPQQRPEIKPDEPKPEVKPEEPQPERKPDEPKPEVKPAESQPKPELKPEEPKPELKPDEPKLDAPKPADPLPNSER